MKVLGRAKCLCQQMGVWECTTKFLYTILDLCALVCILEQAVLPWCVVSQLRCSFFSPHAAHLFSDKVISQDFQTMVQASLSAAQRIYKWWHLFTFWVVSNLKLNKCNTRQTYYNSWNMMFRWIRTVKCSLCMPVSVQAFSQSAVSFVCVCVQVFHVWLRTVPCICMKTLFCHCCQLRSLRTNTDATSSETT